jgi:hypothetical protein
MSIFGKIDAEQVTTNPFFIEKGEYQAEVTKSYIKTNRDDVRQLLITFTIANVDSEFYEKTATRFFDLPDKDMTEEALALLPADEKKKIKNNMSAIKQMLCGRDGYANQPGLGVDPNDLNDESWNPEVLMGTKVDLAISNYGPNNQGVQIRWANVITE